MTTSQAAAAPTFTVSIDLEDHRADQRQPQRYVSMSRRVLEFLEARQIRATVFIVADAARSQPELVREILASGHELASHSLDHKTLDQHSPESFRDATHEAKATLEDLSGQPVRGYRAPVFSLTRQTTWATEVLAELGFQYSSSMMPVGNPLHSYAGAPQTPFRWSSGLLELPVPVARIGPVYVPFLGGFYLRYLPRLMLRRAWQNTTPGCARWSYVHPYDFDIDEPFGRMRDTAFWVSTLLWFNRRRAFAKLAFVLDQLVGQDPIRSFEERIAAGEFDAVPEWSPSMD
ncbi:MAG: polysaccharide deacetylase family protein [Pseudomonadota bacterium]